MKTPNATHTATPWKVGLKPGPFIYGPLGEQVADFRSEIGIMDQDEQRANAAHIVKCVNSHEELLSFLKESQRHPPQTLSTEGYDWWLEKLEKVIARAEGGI